MASCGRCGASMFRGYPLRHAGEQQLIVWEEVPVDEPVEWCPNCGNYEDATIRKNKGLEGGKA